MDKIGSKIMNKLGPKIMNKISLKIMNKIGLKIMNKILMFQGYPKIILILLLDLFKPSFFK